MIVHVVMWNVRGNDRAEKFGAAARLKVAFESLAGRIPGLTRIEVGIDTSWVDYACDVVLYSEFQDQASLDAYATHPEHLRIRAEIGDLRIARHQVDYVRRVN